MTLDMPPGGCVTGFTPEALQPFIGQGEDSAMGLENFISLLPAQSANHELPHICEVEMMLGRNAQQSFLRMERTQKNSTS